MTQDMRTVDLSTGQRQVQYEMELEKNWNCNA